MRIKKRQYWELFARRHANCPRNHHICYAGGVPARHDYDTVDDEEEQPTTNTNTQQNTNEIQAAATQVNRTN